MSNALAVKYTANDGQEVSLDADSVNRYVISGNARATDAEIAGFLAICKARGLNPLARDAYLVKYSQGSPASTIVSKDYYNRVAQQQPSYDGMDAGVVIARPDGTLEYREGALVGNGEHLVGGWAKVFDRKRSHPSTAVVSMDEYDQQKSLWKTKPATMIRKVAMVQALREAYPSSFQGLYDESEMPEAPQPIPAQEVQVQQQPKPQEDLRTKARKETMAQKAERLARATGQDVDTCKKTLFQASQAAAGGDKRGFLALDDQTWTNFISGIEANIAQAEAAHGSAAADYDEPLDEGDYIIEDGSELAGEEYQANLGI